MNWLSWLLPSKAAMSADWLAQINRPTTRVEFHGVCPKWPMNKQRDESSLWNRHTLRKVS